MAIPNDKHPLVSVRLMTYNHEPFIAEAIESCLIQKTNFKFEIVIGDDFSTDGTTDICKKYAEEHPDIIRLLDRQVGDDYWQKRQTLGRLYNFVNILQNCQGKYIALLDGDDYWTDPYKLQKQVDVLEKNGKYSVCTHDADKLDMFRNEKYEFYNSPIANRTEFHLADIINGQKFPTASLLFRRECFRINELPKWYYKIVSGDRFMLIHLSMQGPIYFIPEKMSVYRLHEQGFTGGGFANWENSRLLKYRKAQLYFWRKIYLYVGEDYRGPVLLNITGLIQEIRKLYTKSGKRFYSHCYYFHYLVSKFRYALKNSRSKLR